MGSAETKRKGRNRSADRRAAAAGVLGQGGTQQEAAAVAGCTDRAVRNWLKDPEFNALVAEAREHCETDEPGELGAIRRELWKLARSGTGTSRVTACKALASIEVEQQPAEVDWTKLEPDEIPDSEVHRIVGALLERLMADRSPEQRLVFRVAQIETTHETALCLVERWAQPPGDLVTAISVAGLTEALTADARALERALAERPSVH